jgi:hypothetical protein
MYKGQEGDLSFEWRDPLTGALYDFTSGFTLKFQLVSNGEYYFQKTTGIIPIAPPAIPNVRVSIATAELAVALLVPGLYIALLTMTRISDSADLIFRQDDPPIMEILATPVLAT